MRTQAQGSALRSKFNFPFRVGCTSYVIADDILPNVKRMAPIIDDIEIVLFESSDISNLPTSNDIAQMKALADQYCITYTVHLPIDYTVGTTISNVASRFCEEVQRILDIFSELNPYAYIMHLDGVSADDETTESVRWHNCCSKLLESLVQSAGDKSNLLCIENLAYPWHWHADLVINYGLATCIDIGHLWINYAESWQKQVEAMLPFSRVIHLHGAYNGVDHLSLKKVRTELLGEVLQMMCDSKYTHVVTLELFNEMDTLESLDLVRHLWRG